MSGIRRDVQQCVGNTSLLPLRRISPKNGARILLKLECAHSLKNLAPAPPSSP